MNLPAQNKIADWWISTLLTAVEEAIGEQKCKVPKNPLPKNLNDLETLTVERIDECLKYAGRFNYNKAIDDILATLKANNK